MQRKARRIREGGARGPRRGLSPGAAESYYASVVVIISGADDQEAAVSHQGLGDFEQIVLLAILQLDGEVYGVPVVDEIERRTGRSVSRSAVYVTLRRLEHKGLISSWMSDPVPERGGKPRRCVKVEPEGLRLLRESRRTMEQMWQGLDPALGDVR
jgi:DNA-binding PadR family transcriptional regulator